MLGMSKVGYFMLGKREKKLTKALRRHVGGLFR